MNFKLLFMISSQSKQINSARVVKLFISTLLFATMGCESIESEFQKCRQDGLCGPVLKVKKATEDFPNSPNHYVWRTEASTVEINLGPQLITSSKFSRQQ